MTRKVVRSAAAAEDMLSIADDLISDLGIEAALAADERIDDAIESLATLSHRGRGVPELRARGVTTYRELITMPFRIIYRVEPREIWIVAVLDHRRDLDQLLVQRARRDREG
jgi:plasmid stabilization system protein ParE